MLPTISNLLNPSSSSNQVERTDQPPTLPPPPIHPTSNPPKTTPKAVNPGHGPAPLSAPAAMLNIPNAAVTMHPRPPVYPIAFCNCQPVGAESEMFPVPSGDAYQGVYGGNYAYPFYYSCPAQTAFAAPFRDPVVHTDAIDTVFPETAANHFSVAVNSLPSTAVPTTHFLLPTPAYFIPTTDANRNPPPAILPVTAEPPQDPPVARIVLPEGQNTRNGVVPQKRCQDTQQPVGKTLSDHPMTHLTPITDRGQHAPSTTSTQPQGNSPSPDSCLAPRNPGQPLTLKTIPAPIISAERLFPCAEELEFRKQHFLQNVYPPTIPIISPLKRSRTHQQSEQKNSGLDQDADEELQNGSNRKIMKRSHSATELLLEFANSDHVDQDASTPGSTDGSPRDITVHKSLRRSGASSTAENPKDSSPPKHDDRPKGESQMRERYVNTLTPTVVGKTRSSQNSSAKSKSPAVYDRITTKSSGKKEGIAPSNEAGPSETHCSQGKISGSKALAMYRSSYKKTIPVGNPLMEAEEDEIQPNRTRADSNHAVDQLIMQARLVNNSYRCEECSATFANEDSIIRHKRVQHTVATSASKMVNCPECALLLRNKQNLKRHLATHGPNAKHKCPECTAKFVTERARTTHMKDAHGRKAEQRSVRNKSTRCPVKDCAYASNQKTNVKRHYENKHLNIKRFHCTRPTCDYVGSTRANRQAHMKTHEKEDKDAGKVECGSATQSENGSNEEESIAGEKYIESHEGMDKIQMKNQDDSDEGDGSSPPSQNA